MIKIKIFNKIILTRNGSGCGYGRPKNIRIRMQIRIRNTDNHKMLSYVSWAKGDIVTRFRDTPWTYLKKQTSYNGRKNTCEQYYLSFFLLLNLRCFKLVRGYFKNLQTISAYLNDVTFIHLQGLNWWMSGNRWNMRKLYEEKWTNHTRPRDTVTFLLGISILKLFYVSKLEA